MSKVIELKLGEDFQVLGNSGSGNVSAPLVFAGYGTTAKDIKFDEYKDLDVAGKIVVLIRRVPRWNDKPMPFDGKQQELLTPAWKANWLWPRSTRPPAVILINDASEKGDKLVSFELFTSAARPASIPGRQRQPGRAGSGVAIGPEEIPGRDRKGHRRGFEAAQRSAHGLVGHHRLQRESRAARRSRTSSACSKGPARWPTRPWSSAPITIISATAASAAGIPRSRTIHHGADDNASGTTSVMELARRFGAMQESPGPAHRVHDLQRRGTRPARLPPLLQQGPALPARPRPWPWSTSTWSAGCRATRTTRAAS